MYSCAHSIFRKRIFCFLRFHWRSENEDFLQKKKGSRKLNPTKEYPLFHWFFCLTFKIYSCTFTTWYTVLRTTSLIPCYIACSVWFADWFASTIELTVVVFCTYENIRTMCQVKWIKYWKEKHTSENIQWMRMTRGLERLLPNCLNTWRICQYKFLLLLYNIIC